jgi:hypothetical protein
MQLQVLQLAETYQKGAVERLRRMGLFAADLDGKSPRRTATSPHVNDFWYDSEQRVGE